MSLESAIQISSEALTNVAARLSVISNNVANASTSEYSDETLTQRSLTASGVGMGVQTGIIIRSVNQAIQSDLFSQNGTVADLELTQSSLQPIGSTLGAVGQGNDIASLLGTLQDGFSLLSSDPTNVAAQSQVVSDATQLSSSINALSASYTAARQNAQDDMVSAVGTLNQALTIIGTLSDEITRAYDAGESVADLENQRDEEYQTVSSLLSVKFVSLGNGDVSVETADGLTLPIRDESPALTTSSASVGPDGNIGSGVTLYGVDVTSQLLGGRIGADLTLRDTTLPTYESELDEFSMALSTRFADQGLTLFTKPDGTIPAAGGTPVQSTYLGYASEVTVNPAVIATPSQVRDGNATIAGSATGASAFTPNATGSAGFETLISRVLNFTFGTDAQVGVTWPATATSGLGSHGTLSAPYDGSASLSDLASSMISAQSQDIANAGTQLTSEQQLQATLQTQLAAGSGVSIDNEMSNMLQLENAYGANAKIVSAMQSLFSDVLGLVQ